MRITFYLLLLLGAVPLLIYPFVLLAGVMSLAAGRTGNEPVLLMVVGYSFLLGSIAYPAVYVICTVLAFVKESKNRTMPTYCAAAPLVYLLVIVALFFATAALEK